MEPFLSTLPPYVHTFLNRHPATEVFNLLRELICFAVLYSDDRDRINSANEELLKKNSNQLSQIARENPDKYDLSAEATETAISKGIAEMGIHKATAAEEMSNEAVVSSADTQVTKKPQNPNMPNTFPEWWSHHDSVPSQNLLNDHKNHNSNVHHNHNRNNTHDSNNSNNSDDHANDSNKASVIDHWISFDAIPRASSSSSTSSTSFSRPSNRLERARSQIIPNLRSYPNEDQQYHARTALSRTSSPKLTNGPTITTTDKKRHSTLGLRVASPAPLPRTNTNTANTTSSPSPLMAKSSSTKISRRVSSTFITANPPAITTTKTQKLREMNSKVDNSPTPSTSNISRRSSFVISPPRENAAMRARAEHTRLQQEEQEKKKNAPAEVGSSTSLRLKQKANSGIDWETIKKERRRTIAGEAAPDIIKLVEKENK